MKTRALACAVLLTACSRSEPPLPGVLDAGGHRSPLDGGVISSDSGAESRPDSGAESPPDGGFSSDAESTDAAPADAEPTDSGAPMPDAGASSPDAGVNPCAFGPPAVRPALDPRTGIAVSRLDALTTCVAARPAEAAVLVDAFLAEHEAQGGGAPWANGQARVLFRGDASQLTISGSFDGWPNPGTRTFQNVPGTDLHFALIPVASGERHQFKLTRQTSSGVDWFMSPIDRWVTWDGIQRGGPGEFNNELVGPTHVIARSLVRRFFVRDRDVFLQLPVAHFNGIQTMGVLYVHDGNEMLTRAGMQDVVDQTITAQEASPLALAYIALPSQDVRSDEYTFGTASARGNAYVNMIANEIVPVIEPNVRTGPMPALRGLAGASLGGLISMHGAWIRNDMFNLVGAQSPSFWWDNDEIVGRVNIGMMITARIYLDSGSPADNSVVTQNMANVLAARGYDHRHVIETGAAHEWPFWAGRFPQLLAFLYP